MTTKTTAPKASPTPTAAAFQQHLREIHACSDARAWAKGKTAQQAWDKCERVDWLLWWVARDTDRKPDIVRVACRIARLVLHLVPVGEDRPRLAIEAAEKWADEPTDANMKTAREARRAAAYAAADAADADAAAAAYAAADAGENIRRKSLAIIREVFTCPWGGR